MDKSLAKLLLIPVVAVCALYALRNFTGEVATLYTLDDLGQSHATRVWIVDHGHEIWIRSVDPTSDWLDRLIADPQVQVRRGDSIAKFRATPLTDRRARVNALMAEHYGWAEWVLSHVEGRDDAVPVYLDPLS